jgi:hypothetical protein
MSSNGQTGELLEFPMSISQRYCAAFSCPASSVICASSERLLQLAEYTVSSLKRA